jgi:predicted DNA-binding protein YlxM (UPF0122 family)
MKQEDFIIEVLDLFKSKLENGNCTKEQVDAVHRMVSENLDIFASAEEIAKHYGKSTDAVHSVIKRRMFEKPRRNITLYSFKAFRRIVPSSWLKKH